MIGPVRGPRGVGFIGHLADLRKNKRADAGQEPAVGAPAPARFQGQAQLNQLGVDPKLIRAHGPVLATALKPLTALVSASRAGEPWQVKAFTRVLDQSLKLLGRQLVATPGPLREEAAQSTLQAWADLVDRPSVGGHAPFALAAAGGLLDSGLRMQARGSLDYDGPHLASLGAESSAAVGALADELVGRDAAPTLLNLFPRLVETLEMTSQGLPPDARADLVDRTRDFVVRTFPATGGSLALAADLSGALVDAAEKHPGDVAAALEAARGAFLALTAEGHAAARGAFDAPPHEALAPLYGALQGVADAHPAGPEATFQILQQPHALDALGARAAAEPEVAPVLDALTTLVQRTAKRPNGPAVAGWVLQTAPQLADPPARDALLAAMKDKGDAGPARALVRAQLAVLGQAPDALDAPLGALDDLDATQALAVGLIVRAHAAAIVQQPELVAALADRVRAAGATAPLDDLGAFADHYLTAAQRLPAGVPALDAVRGAVLAAIAQHTPDEGLPANAYNQLSAALQDVAQRLPKADLPGLIGPDADGRPGLLAVANPGPGVITAPAQTLTQLLQATQDAGEDPDALVRLAAPLAVDLAFVQNGAALQIARVVKDFEAAAKAPGKLRAAAGGQNQAAMRSMAQAPKLAKYAAAHEGMPLDLLATAGVHLSADQIAWVQDRVAATRGLDTIRALRDTVFAAVDSERLDLVEALRTSDSPSKAISAVLKDVAQQYRTQQADKVPYDALVKGLKAGGDPIADLVAERTKAQLGGLDLHALTGGRLDPDGVAEIESLAANVAELLSQFRTEFKSMDKEIDMGKLRPVLEACLKSVAEGTWPAPKYEDEASQRQLAILSPAQQATWRSRTEVSGGAAPAAPADQDLSGPVALLKGLKAQWADAVALPDGVATDAATAQRLRGELKDVLTELRGADKGSAEHRAASRRAGPIRDQLALVELGIALEGMNEAAAPNQLVAELGPALRAAQPALRRHGAPGLLAATAEVVQAAQDLAPARGTRTGKWAMDDDSLTSMIAAHRSGCLAKGSNLRRWGLAGALADANTKMIRVFDGDKQLWRTFLRMVPVKIGNYEGPGLYIESPVADSGGNAEDRKLLDQVVFDKALAMGVPALFINRGGQVPEGWKGLGKSMVTLTYDYGHTGLYHSDYVGQQKQQAKGPGTTWDVNTQNLEVVFPPEMADQAP